MTIVQPYRIMSNIDHTRRMGIDAAFTQTLSIPSQKIYVIPRLSVDLGLPYLELRKALDNPETLSHREVVLQYSSPRLSIKNGTITLTESCISHLGKKQNESIEVVQSGEKERVQVWSRENFFKHLITLSA